jgi:hypothetical protein
MLSCTMFAFAYTVTVYAACGAALLHLCAEKVFGTLMMPITSSNVEDVADTGLLHCCCSLLLML